MEGPRYLQDANGQNGRKPLGQTAEIGPSCPGYRSFTHVQTSAGDDGHLVCVWGRSHLCDEDNHNTHEVALFSTATVLPSLKTSNIPSHPLFQAFSLTRYMASFILSASYADKAGIQKPVFLGSGG